MSTKCHASHSLRLAKVLGVGEPLPRCVAGTIAPLLFLSLSAVDAAPQELVLEEAWAHPLSWGDEVATLTTTPSGGVAFTTLNRGRVVWLDSNGRQTTELAVDHPLFEIALRSGKVEALDNYAGEILVLSGGRVVGTRTANRTPSTRLISAAPHPDGWVGIEATEDSVLQFVALEPGPARLVTTLNRVFRDPRALRLKASGGGLSIVEVDAPFRVFIARGDDPVGPSIIETVRFAVPSDLQGVHMRQLGAIVFDHLVITTLYDPTSDSRAIVVTSRDERTDSSETAGRVSRFFAPMLLVAGNQARSSIFGVRRAGAQEIVAYEFSGRTPEFKQ